MKFLSLGCKIINKIKILCYFFIHDLLRQNLFKLENNSSDIVALKISTIESFLGKNFRNVFSSLHE
jgi:hypothetical protein